MRATLVYRGSRATATRVDLGPLTDEATAVDWWVIRLARRDAVHITVRRPAGSGAFIVRVQETLWRSDGTPIPDTAPSGVVYRFMMVASIERVREIARHLARNVAEGNLPARPAEGDDRIAWTRAVGVAEAFTERFGSFESALREATA